MLFSAYGMKPMAALALTAALYHVASHAFFKSLLFVGTGAVLHATGQRSLGKLGGLIRYMPWVAWLTLVGTLASAGLPPLGGFVSEWLLLQSFLFTPGLPSSFLNMLIPVVAALIALVAALSGYTMVKFFGVIFLGQPRENNLSQAQRAGPWERAGMVWLALGCVALGLLPVQFIQLIDAVTRQLVAAGIGSTVASSGWLLVPVDVERASYGPVVFLLGLAASFALAFALVRRLYHGRLRRAAPWDCGYPWQTARGCRTRPRASASRSGRSSSPSFACSANCPRRSIASRAIASSSATISGIGSTCRWPISSNACRAGSGGCSRGGSRSTCSTAS